MKLKKAFRKARRTYKRAEKNYMKMAKLNFILIVAGACLLFWEHIKTFVNYALSFF